MDCCARGCPGPTASTGSIRARSPRRSPRPITMGTRKGWLRPATAGRMRTAVVRACERATVVRSCASRGASAVSRAISTTPLPSRGGHRAFPESCTKPCAARARRRSCATTSSTTRPRRSRRWSRTAGGGSRTTASASCAAITPASASSPRKTAARSFTCRAPFRRGGSRVDTIGWWSNAPTDSASCTRSRPEPTSASVTTRSPTASSTCCPGERLLVQTDEEVRILRADGGLERLLARTKS